jgi:hypothetical protein
MLPGRPLRARSAPRPSPPACVGDIGCVPGEPAVAAVLRRADSTYELQHATDDGRRPAAWRTTIADVAADLDVIDRRVLVAAWADAVKADLAGFPTRG